MNVHRASSSEYSRRSEEQAVIQAPKEFNKSKGKARATLYQMLMRYPLAVVAMFPALFQGCAPVAIFLIFGHVLNVFGVWVVTRDDQAAMEDCKYWAMWVIVLATGAGLCNFLQTFLWIRVGSKFTILLKNRMFANMMRSDVSFFDVTPVGGILTLLGEDAQVVKDNFGIIKGQQFKCLGQFIAGLVLAYVYCWKMALIATCVIPFIVIILYSLSRAVHYWINLKFRHTAESMTMAQETLSCIRTVRSFNREDSEWKRFVHMTKKVRHEDSMTRGFITLMMVLVLLGLWSIIIGNLYYGGKLASEGELQGGDVISVFGFVMFGSMGLIELQTSMQAERRAISAGARILGMIRYKSEIPFSGGERIENFKGHIKFNHVSFKYPTRDVYVLKDVTFEVQPGQMAALVGHSGSGKSTCVQLLERFYDVTEGEILLDGHDIRSLDPQWLHEQMGLVSQEPILFHASIRDNIKYGCRDATDAEVEMAAEQANAKKFIEKLEGGYDRIVGEKGSSLSGGQRQRIAIARALIKDPVILITDEATSALDAGSEKKVQEALDRVMENRTSVVVAHRLSTVRNAKITYVFDAGEIKEQGTHDELLKRKGYYYDLVRRQLTQEDIDAIAKAEEHAKDSPQKPDTKTPEPQPPIPEEDSESSPSSFSSSSSD